eukprot:475248-Prorocentrum_lima.AAC.1
MMRTTISPGPGTPVRDIGPRPPLNMKPSLTAHRTRPTKVHMTLTRPRKPATLEHGPNLRWDLASLTQRHRRA